MTTNDDSPRVPTPQTKERFTALFHALLRYEIAGRRFAEAAKESSELALKTADMLADAGMRERLEQAATASIPVIALADAMADKAGTNALEAAAIIGLKTDAVDRIRFHLDIEHAFVTTANALGNNGQAIGTVLDFIATCIMTSSTNKDTGLPSGSPDMAYDILQQLVKDAVSSAIEKSVKILVKNGEPFEDVVKRFFASAEEVERPAGAATH